MLRLSQLSLIVCLAVFAGSAQAALTFTVLPSSAPNAFGSPSWSTYATNALNSLENGLGNVGNRNVDPTAYEIAGAYIEPGDIVVSGFNSWRGMANPSGAFSGEFGNRLHFGLRIAGGGNNPQFRLNDLAYDFQSDDSGDSLDFTGNFAGLGYNANRYGIEYGVDQVKGGGDDTIYTTGNGLTLVDEIVYVGIGNAFDATFEPGGTDQDKLDSAIGYINSEAPFNISCAYTMYGTDGTTILGSGGASVIVPTPGALALLGFAGLISRRRRRS